jgi:hypothetical protein
MSVDRIKTEVLPEVFAQPSRIATYGALEDSSVDLASLAQQAPVTQLADSIQRVISKLTDADPKVLARKPSPLSRWTGSHLELRVRYEVARESLSELIETAHVHAQGVRDFLGMLDVGMASFEHEIGALQDHLQAGREYLAQNPQAGLPIEGALDFTNHRERFARKLANLATLQASHELSLAQLRLVRSSATDLLDRFEEAVSVLVPVWRQQAFALQVGSTLSGEQVSNAVQAHAQLTHSLSQSLAALDRGAAKLH